MNREGLKRRLEEEGVSPSSYDLRGGLPSEAYCLEECSNAWAVYYSERGSRVRERLFGTEDAACAYLLETILADPTTRPT
jgi:hypothetical protein